MIPLMARLNMNDVETDEHRPWRHYRSCPLVLVLPVGLQRVGFPKALVRSQHATCCCGAGRFGSARGSVLRGALPGLGGPRQMSKKSQTDAKG